MLLLLHWPQKRKSLHHSCLRRQEWRKCEAKAKADKTASEEESISKDVEKRPFIVVSTVKGTQLVSDANIEDSAVKQSKNIVEKPQQNFKCNQCDYVNNTNKLMQVLIQVL